MAFASETATAKQLKDAADALDIAMKALEAKKPDNNNDNNNGNNGNNKQPDPGNRQRDRRCIRYSLTTKLPEMIRLK